MLARSKEGGPVTSVYIHIPFCERICSYCDFPRRVGSPKQFMEYLNALEKEIDFYGEIPPLDTLYIGGGTPSILQGETLQRFAKMLEQFRLKDDYEFTIECNPEHITEDRLAVYRQIGINRISLGVQTFQTKQLRLLNRAHDREMIFKAVQLLKANGFENISIDLMFSLPLQRLSDLYEDLELFLSLDIPHLSSYSLILEDKTVLAYQVMKNQVQLLDNETEALMYQIVMDRLKGAGYHHYEISNFAKPGYESKHNRVYWQNEQYYGFGMGASGYIENKRYYNEDQLKSYLTRINAGEKPIRHIDKVDRNDRLKEAMMLGLRLIDGISIDELNQKYNVNIEKQFDEELTYLERKGWVKVDSHIRLTGMGLFYGNEVFGMFL